MKRRPIDVNGRHQQCHHQPAGSRDGERCLHLNLARSQEAHAIGGGVILRIVLIPVIGVGVVVGVRVRVVIMLVLLMNQPRMLKQCV